jgi:methylthioribulose-1-phosphate dehydratase
MSGPVSGTSGAGQPLNERQALGDPETVELLVELLREFHGRSWVSGTGGGICGPSEDGNLFLAPTGVHKERVRPEDFFVVSPQDGHVVRAPADERLRPSECNAIFGLVARERGARSVVHSHGLVAVLAADLATDGVLEIRDLEMLKGIRGLTNRDVHRVPVIDNTPREAELVSTISEALADGPFGGTFAVIVRDHGAYIWGDDVWEAKRHTEVYHFLFEAILARQQQSKRSKEGTR